MGVRRKRLRTLLLREAKVGVAEAPGKALGVVRVLVLDMASLSKELLLGFRAVNEA